jgi:hypothetical protein
VAGADAEFVLGAYHSAGLDSADLGLLDLEVSGKDGADLGEEDFLACSDVGGAADYADGLAGADIHRGDVEMVAVGVGLAGEDLGNYHSGETSGNLFGLFYSVNLYAYGCHGLRNLCGGEVTLQVIF